MDESSSTAVVDSAPITEGNTPEPTSTPVPETPNPQESPNQPEPSDPAPQTPMPDQPDHGIDPDKGIDPDAGDLPTDPDHNTAGEPTDSIEDTSKMTRAERAAHYQNIEREQQREVTKAVSEAYQPEDVQTVKDRYLEQGYDDGMATMLARQDISDQKAEIAQATATIAELNANLKIGTFEAQSKYDWMNPAKSDAYDKQAHNDAAAIFSQGITTDPRTGQIVEARMTPMQAAELVDRIRQSGAAQAGVKAQKAAEAQMAAVAPSSSASQTRETPFAELSLDQQRAKLRAQGHYVT